MTRPKGPFWDWWLGRVPGYEGMCKRPFGADLSRAIWEASKNGAVADFHSWWLYHGWELLPGGCERSRSLEFGEVIWNAARSTDAS